MAEFCLNCMNNYIIKKNKKLTEKDVTLGFDYCEGCGEWKPCVITIKEKNIFKRIKNNIKRLCYIVIKR